MLKFMFYMPLLYPRSRRYRFPHITKRRSYSPLKRHPLFNLRNKRTNKSRYSYFRYNSDARKHNKST